MQSATALTVRSWFGLVLGLFLSVVGWFVGWLVTPPGPQINLALLILGASLGAGGGAFVGWFKPEVPSQVNAVHLILSLAGGLVGGWIGWTLGQWLYPEGLRNPVAPFGSPPIIVGLLGGSVGANLLAFGYYSLRMWRNREV